MLRDKKWPTAHNATLFLIQSDSRLFVHHDPFSPQALNSPLYTRFVKKHDSFLREVSKILAYMHATDDVLP